LAPFPPPRARPPGGGGRRYPFRGPRRAIASAIRSLERVASRRGSETTEPSGPARFYVGVGEPGNQASLDGDLVAHAAQYLRSQIESMDGVSMAPQDESRNAANRAIRRNNLTGYFIDSSIVRVEETDVGTRVVVSVIVNTYPGRDMRAILNGAATVPGASGARAIRAAMEGALRSATRRLLQAMESSRR
ncbi:MAG: hypothetical protein AAF645_03535, partial [Myxococcota bacterium]